VWVLEGGYDLRAIGDSMVACIDILADRGYNSGSSD